MAITSAGSISAPLSADSARNQQSFVASYNVGSPGTGATIVFPEAAQGFTVVNPSANWVRVRVNFHSSVTTSIPAASRVILLAPQASQSVDYGANNSDDLVAGVSEPVVGVEVEIVDPSALGSGVITDSAALPVVGSVTSPARVVFNVASA